MPSRQRRRNFYPRPPRGGRRGRSRGRTSLRHFYPRPPRGGRHDIVVPPYLIYEQDFYPRPPRGGRPLVFTDRDPKFNFYPRPPRGGRPGACSALYQAAAIFLSTPSARRATDPKGPEVVPQNISIHALREEGDTSRQGLFPDRRHFYPRPPRGGRQGKGTHFGLDRLFLSTPSARRATAKTEKNISAFVSL